MDSEFERPIINTAAPQKPIPNPPAINGWETDKIKTQEQLFDSNDSVTIKYGSVTTFPITKSKVFFQQQNAIRSDIPENLEKRFKNIEVALQKEINKRLSQHDGLALALAQLDSRLKELEKKNKI